MFFSLFLFLHPVGVALGDGFPAGTMILTPEGTKQIETLRTGDRVIAITKQGDAVPARIESIASATAQLVVLRTRHGRLVTTDEHPLRFATGDFLPPTEIRPRERLSVWRKGRMKRTTVVEVRFLDDEAAVYNLSVDGPNTFIADGFVVHN